MKKPKVQLSSEERIGRPSNNEVLIESTQVGGENESLRIYIGYHKVPNGLFPCNMKPKL